MTFQESGFSFEFPISWTVVKFDEHRFYKYLSGDGFKGVDFLSISNTGKLHLLEVKNYFNFSPRDHLDPSVIFLEDPISYADSYWKKYQDSIYLIKLIHKYYLRRPWYRFYQFLNLQKWEWLAMKKDWGIWTKAYDLISAMDQTHQFDLWLEFEKIDSEELETAFRKIKEYLRLKSENLNVEIHILNRNNQAYLQSRKIN